MQRQLLIKQTLFGLSWLAVGALLPYAKAAAPAFSLQTWALIVLAFTLARFSGMHLNRLIDLRYDSLNERTKNRPLPKGELSSRACLVQALTFMLGFFFIAWTINPLCGKLSFVVGSIIALYSYAKRFTRLCHLILGSVHFFAPVCAWAAVTGSLSLAPVLLGSALLLSIAAGDIIYACQDIEFDRKIGLYSVPASFGTKRACLIAQVLHVASVCCLWALSNLMGSPMLFLATSLVACLYASFHVKLNRGDVGFDTMFSFINTLSGAILFIFTLGEIAWHCGL